MLKFKTRIFLSGSPLRGAMWHAGACHGRGVAVCGLQPLDDRAIGVPVWTGDPTLLAVADYQGAYRRQIFFFFSVKRSDKMIASHAAECWSFQRKQLVPWQLRARSIQLLWKMRTESPKERLRPSKQVMMALDTHEISYDCVTPEKKSDTENSVLWDFSDTMWWFFFLRC